MRAVTPPPTSRRPEAVGLRQLRPTHLLVFQVSPLLTPPATSSSELVVDWSPTGLAIGYTAAF